LSGRLRAWTLAASGLVSLALANHAFAGGSFTSSDTRLNAIWAASVQTARDMVVDPVDLQPGCGIPPEQKTKVIIDGVVRDRCEFTGDLAVTGMTLYVADGARDVPMRQALFLFAERQRPDGLIPPKPGDHGPGLVDYTAYWIEDVYDYVLYSGDAEAARALLPHVERALDVWYPAQMSHGLVANRLAPRADYALIDRLDPFVAYYNAQYVRALDLGAVVARWAGRPDDRRRWVERARALRPVIQKAFWDPAAGAYKDTVSGPLVHPQDGNVFAVLAQIGTHAQSVSALEYLAAHDWYGYGDSIADNDTWDGPPWGYQASRRVYPFMSYYAVLASFQSGRDGAAFDLLRREWGYMLENGPRSTMWETIGPYGGGPTGGSWDHGWSSGAAPALTNYVLGVRPTSPGFTTFVVTPHVEGLQWAAGDVPTPHGPIHVSWRAADGRAVLRVRAPRGTSWSSG
jgi:hypothetical protein